MKKSSAPRLSPQSIGICFSCGIRKQNGKDVLAWDTKARVDKALMLYKLGFIDAILCTGGIFQKGQTRAASVVMAEYLEQKGVPTDVLFTEEKSFDTCENSKFSLDVLKKKGFLEGITSTEDLRVVLISETHHLRRIEITTQAYLKQLGLDELVPLIFEPVFYSISNTTYHTEEAGLHLTALDPTGEGKIFEDIRTERRSAAKTKR